MIVLVSASLAVYLLMLLAWLLRGVAPGLVDTLSSVLVLPALPAEALVCPWTPLTYMFTHISFIHLLVNMLWLIGFGAVLKGGARTLAAVYFAGGLAGAGAFWIYNTLCGNSISTLAGASAAVIAVVVASAILSPRRKVNLLFLTNVEIRYIAPVALLTLFVSLGNFGADTCAHLGGLIAGLVAGAVLHIRYSLMSDRAMAKAREVTRRRILLDKASTSGFASLSVSERSELFEVSRQDIALSVGKNRKQR